MKLKLVLSLLTFATVSFAMNSVSKAQCASNFTSINTTNLCLPPCNTAGREWTFDLPSGCCLDSIVIEPNSANPHANFLAYGSTIRSKGSCDPTPERLTFGTGHPECNPPSQTGGFRICSDTPGAQFDVRIYCDCGNPTSITVTI